MLLCSFKMVRHSWIFTRRSCLCCVSSLGWPRVGASATLVWGSHCSCYCPGPEFLLSSWVQGNVTKKLVRAGQNSPPKEAQLSVSLNWLLPKKERWDSTDRWWAPAGIAASPFFLAWQVLPNELFCIKYWSMEVKELLVAEPRVFEILSFLHIFEYFGDWLCTNLFSGFLYVVNN